MTQRRCIGALVCGRYLDVRSDLPTSLRNRRCIGDESSYQSSA